MSKKLPREFYTENKATEAAPKLIGKKLCTKLYGEYTAGIITETEAYMGEIDKAAHTYGGKETERTKVLFEKGGKAYIFLVYGLHYLLNATIGEKDNPECVLIRSIIPTDGLEIIKWRRFGEESSNTPVEKIANGPAKLTQALGIDKSLYGESLRGRKIWIEEGIDIPKDQIITSPRIGIEYAEEFEGKEWRFVVEDSLVQENLK